MGQISSFIWIYVQCEGLGHRDQPLPSLLRRERAPGLHASQAWTYSLLKWPFIHCRFPQLKR